MKNEIVSDYFDAFAEYTANGVLALVDFPDRVFGGFESVVAGDVKLTYETGSLVLAKDDIVVLKRISNGNELMYRVRQEPMRIEDGALSEAYLR